MSKETKDKDDESSSITKIGAMMGAKTIGIHLIVGCNDICERNLERLEKAFGLELSPISSVMDPMNSISIAWKFGRQLIVRMRHQQESFGIQSQVFGLTNINVCGLIGGKEL